MHIGPQALQAVLSQMFWITSARQAIRSELSNCHVCLRERPVFHTPRMSDLPKERVTVSKPFEKVGTDFGGPFSITLSKARGGRSMKAYLCLFVCLSTKAVHLEAVSNLSTDAFLAALRRFIARRGRCNYILSDCGTNYKGAARYLNELHKLLVTDPGSTEVGNALATHGIVWQFNPPSSPHFGGIFEAGIKSTKKLLTKVVGKQVLTFEEFATVLAQVEAQLNSRPLYPISNDPADLQVLTPGHFLVGEPLTSMPDDKCSVPPRTLEQRWLLVQKIQTDFWRRWTKEYLNTLQQRSKWLCNSPAPAVGSLAIIKDDCAHPLYWRLGRVIELKPGPDGTARVAILQTSNGHLTRPLTKLCFLPLES